MRTRSALYLAMVLATAAPALAEQAGHAGLFPRPAQIETPIRFWRAIFTDYSMHQVVLHDAFTLDKIYRVLDFRPQVEAGLTPGELERLQSAETDFELERLRRTLPDADAQQLRSQRGIRERFHEGMRSAQHYFPEMERIFRAEGVPVELTRLPLIESCFNLRAYSKAGAAGIWQFMPATGRLYMRVDHLVDERRDPITSTQAAAQFLRRLHDSLGSWPLAVTAYNHGPGGIARAVGEVGSTDIGKIVREYRGRAFGFASRNFYAEFLTALDLEREYQGQLAGSRPAPVTNRTHRLERSLGVQVAARLAQIDLDELESLNPALSSAVLAGRRPIPAGYRLRLSESTAGFETRLAALPAEPRVMLVAARTTVRGKARGARVRTASFVTHRVRPGQTLSHIAKKHGVSVATLRSVNQLGRSSRVRAGQAIKIPARTAAAA